MIGTKISVDSGKLNWQIFGDQKMKIETFTKMTSKRNLPEKNVFAFFGN
jgi:hypothetical protein